MVSELDAQGIDAAVYYPVPTHRLPAYALKTSLPETDRAAAEVLSLPIRPGLTEEEVARVIAAVNGIAEGTDG
jgi:dTDP-4-amino-4,6-dideoxygalactose transaminase